MYSSFSSSVLDLKNNILKLSQNSRFASVLRSFLPLKTLDYAIFLCLILIFVSSAFFSSGIIGFFATMFVFLTVTRLAVFKGEMLEISPLDVLIIIFYLFSIVSLFGSSEFLLSFKGFLKFFLYIGFYFCFSYWIKKNTDKILPIFLTVSLLTMFESFVAIIQNFSHVEAISGWQDTSHINSEDVISRAYGTLKPYNPNLLAGYLVSGLTFLNYFFITNLVNKKRKRCLISAGAILITILAIFFTGCRGAYLALIPFFAVLVYFLKYYIQKYKGGFSNLKKRYKNALYGLCVAFLAFILFNPTIYKRILSIFALREDSSISFRMNVYKSCFEMFLGNPFIGIGLGNQNFREIYGLYMLTGFDALSAYNIFLETACEMGIFGLISFVLILAYAVYISVGFLTKSSNTQEKAIVVTVLTLILILVTHGMIDTIFYRPQVQILFWMMLGILNAIIFRKAQNF